MDKFLKCCSSFFFVGYFPYGPGTAASFVSLPLAYLMLTFSIPVQIVFFVCFLIFSIIVSSYGQELYGEIDSSKIVIDEVMGILCTFIFIKMTLSITIIGFLLFRFFDILKPWPINLIDKKIKNGIGVVMDDVVAGIFANIILRLIIYFKLA